MKQIKEVEKFIKHNYKNIPKPVYTELHTNQFMIIIEDFQPVPYSAVFMSDDKFESITQCIRKWKQSGGETYHKLWIASRTEKSNWMIEDMSHIKFYV